MGLNMGHGQDQPRRIVPPAMPAPAATPPQSRYAPTSQRRKNSGKGKAIAISAAIVVVLLAGAGIALKVAIKGDAGGTGGTVASQPRGSGGVSGNAQTANATIAGEIDTAHPGWIGVQELFAEQATVTIVTYADEAKAARDFAADVADPASIASIAIDNSHGKTDLAVDTSGALLKMTDGTTLPALDPGLMMGTAKQNADAVKAEILPPFTCPPGQKMSGKLLLLPHGTDARKLAALTVRINGQPHEIIGVYSNDPKHVEQMRGGQPPIIPAAPTPAPAVAPASRPS
jgi:hypothetical protein